VPFGKVYAWHPGSVVIECDCGERLTLTGSKTVCGCGADHEATIREELSARKPGGGGLHPWRYSADREDVGLLIREGFG
jgi:hypothetical protein